MGRGVTTVSDGGRPDRRFRLYIALGVLAFSTVALAAVAITIIVVAEGPERTEVAQDIFNALLPVVAAWVGTVLAFYFGQSNFEAASQQAQQLVATASDQPQQRPVTDVMQPIYEMVTFQLTTSPAEVTLTALQQAMQNVNRLLIIGDAQQPRYLIHKSRIDAYVAGGNDPASTLQEFLDSERDAGHEYGSGSGFLTISSTTSLDDAHRSMENSSGVSDVIVTRFGGEQEPVLGWITDVQLRENLRA